MGKQRPQHKPPDGSERSKGAFVKYLQTKYTTVNGEDLDKVRLNSSPLTLHVRQKLHINELLLKKRKEKKKLMGFNQCASPSPSRGETPGVKEFTPGIQRKCCESCLYCEKEREE